MSVMALNSINSWSNVTEDIFNQEILPLNQPAILKGLVSHWPAVEKAKKNNENLYQYFSELYVGGDVRFARIPANEQGRFFYNKTMSGFNFKREIAPLDKFFLEVLSNSLQQHADVLALQSAPIDDYFPKFADENSFELFDKNVPPRIWIGNNAVVSAHYDDAENIACVVAGKRVFTLFPPEQIDNLYIGPMDFTPAGAPLSLVDFNKPDFNKYPKFKQALEQAFTAELEPGDAIYIPSLWWHHVQAVGGVNVLVNYWQGGSINGHKKPVPADTLLMAMLSIRELPLAQRQGWKAFFDYYIFSDQIDKHHHVPDEVKGILAPLDEETQKALKKWLISQLK
ncbi:cupin-like domain-containing protein [Thalassotalea profundi]|uniref:Cupin n=1 Tax=Thalassotalea profundi TaxID=2036687 RepID=A0ABQ3IWY5_9GAMM|nr:cupin-like domain-containing protein [Thalassotalea profundi]GHE95346.1 cupin [Thalassotalea profundi]